MSRVSRTLGVRDEHPANFVIKLLQRGEGGTIEDEHGFRMNVRDLG
jgi:hypothetical protein